MPKKAQADAAVVPTRVPDLAGDFEELPVLGSYVLDTVYEDDASAKREQSGMYLAWKADGLHCWFSDPTPGLQVHLVVPGFYALLPALEILLASNAVPWTQRRTVDRRTGQKKG